MAKKYGILVICAAILFLCFVGSASAKTWYVDDDLQDFPYADFTKIQDAVNIASPGDTVIVYNGTYYENVDVYKSLTIKSTSEKPADTIVQAANLSNPAFHILANNVTIGSFTIKGASYERGITLDNSKYCKVSNNILSGNWDGIGLDYSSNNVIENNICENNSACGIYLFLSPDNTIKNNTCKDNDYGIYPRWANNNTLMDNNVLNNNYGIYLYYSNNNIFNLNNFINNSDAVYSSDSTNIWNATSKITYIYNGSQYTNYLGNYWDNYKEKYPCAEEMDWSGIWDRPYSIDSDNDSYPLVKPFENYFKSLEEKIFDTGAPTNPYPSIFGTHNGTITPNVTIEVSKLYTYPCEGTGGHTEQVIIRNESGIMAEAHWKGYQEDWHNISFNKTFTLVANKTYNYTIRTGSYPQIIHERIANVTGGTITCTEFTDANGRRYKDWVPAIRLEHTMPEIEIAFVIFNETDGLSKYTEQVLSFVNQHIPATFEAITVRLPEATEFTYWGTGEDRCCFLAGWNVRSMGHEEQLPLACLGYFLLWKFKEGDKPCWGGGTWGPIHGLNNKRISSAPYNAWWWSEPGWRPDMPGGTCIILHELHHMIGGTLVDDYKYYKGADSMSEHRYGETIPNIDRMSDFGFTDDYNFTAWCYEQLTEEMCKKLEMIYKDPNHPSLRIKRPSNNPKS